MLVATVVAYSQHFDNGFHFDDSHVIQQNPYIRDPGNIPLFFTDPETHSTLPPNRQYRPLVMVSLAADYWLAGGLEPFFFHLSTFLWFLVQGGLMFLFYRAIAERTLPHRWNAVIAVLMVAWYLLHPANAETINYVVARSDSLSTLCVMAGFVIHQRARSWRRHLAWIPALLGALVKPTGVMFVPLLFLYALLFEEGIGASDVTTERGRQAIRRQLIRILPGAVAMGLLFWFTMAMTPDTWVPGGDSRWRYLITQPFVMLRYVGLFFLPIDLTPDAAWTTFVSVLDPRFFVGAAFVCSAIAAALWLSNRPILRPVSFGILWFFISLLPTSSVVPLAEVTSDHRMFFPFIGLVLAVGWPLGLLAIRTEVKWTATRARQSVVGVAIAFALFLCAWGTYDRSEVWHDEETLWYDNTQRAPSNGRGFMNYGLTQMAKGDYETAMRYYERARETEYREHPHLLVNLAIANDKLGRQEEAERYFREALRRSRNFPAVHFFYARWLHEEGRDDEALRELAIVLQESPGHEEARKLLETVKAASRGLDEVAILANREPTPDGLVELSLRYYEAGRYQESIEAARRALDLRPDYAAAYNNMCAAFNSLGRWEDAIEACEKALEILPGFELARNNLSWARQQQQEANSR